MRALDDELRQHTLTPLPVIGALDPANHTELDDPSLHCLATHGTDCGDEDLAATRNERD